MFLGGHPRPAGNIILCITYYSTYEYYLLVSAPTRNQYFQQACRKVGIYIQYSEHSLVNY